MSRVNGFLVLLLAVSSVCFGATLMQITVQTPPTNTANEDFDASCQQLIAEHHQRALKRAAAEIYQEAFMLNLSGNGQKAQEASICAAHLMNGSNHWRIEAKDWLKL